MEQIGIELLVVLRDVDKLEQLKVAVKGRPDFTAALGHVAQNLWHPLNLVLNASLGLNNVQQMSIGKLAEEFDRPVAAIIQLREQTVTAIKAFLTSVNPKSNPFIDPDMPIPANFPLDALFAELFLAAKGGKNWAGVRAAILRSFTERGRRPDEETTCNDVCIFGDNEFLGNFAISNQYTNYGAPEHALLKDVLAVLGRRLGDVATS